MYYRKHLQEFLAIDVMLISTDKLHEVNNINFDDKYNLNDLCSAYLK